MSSFDNFLKYYNGQEFEEGLNTYFKVEPKDDFPILIMDHCRTDAPYPHRYPHHDIHLIKQDGYKNEREIISEKNIYFATIFFFVALCNHSIDKLLGQDSLQNFLKATHWPLTSFIMAGIRPPYETLQKVDLVYEKNSSNCQKAHAFFREVVPFMKEELNNFFSGNAENLNQAAYDAFCKAIAGEVDEFWQIADPLIEEFTFYRQ